MLKKKNISKVSIYSDEWKQIRLGRFTSSKASSLMQDKENATGFISYVNQKVGEELTGVSSEEEFDNDSVRWGLMYEAEALKKFGAAKGLDFLVVQKLIHIEGTRFSSTPDALIIHGETEDSYNVSTVEVKCFPTYYRYIPLALCNTPSDVKKANTSVYWQVLDQMDNCDCLYGYLVCYHPDFRAGNLNIVEFKKIDLIQDFRLLRQRKQQAVEKFNEIRDSLIKKGVF